MITDVTTPVAACAAGLVASLHCAGMCAPLSCALFQTCSGRKTVSYHLARALSYSVLGGILGLVGNAAAAMFTSPPARLMPVALAALFLAMAFGFDRNFPLPAFLRRWIGLMHVRSGSGFTGAAMLGLATPFIPCGPLYLMLGISLLSGSPARGALLMLCFAIGTMPLYVLAQWQWFHLRGRMSPATLRATQKVLACMSALLIAWRAIANGGLGLSNPLCH